MKHHSSALRSPAFRPQLNRLFDAVMDGLGLWASKLRKGAANLGTQLRIGRMQSVLQSMSDEELKMIHLKRNDIRRRAEFLITYEYDGL